MQAIVINAALDTAGKAIDLGTDPAYSRKVPRLAKTNESDVGHSQSHE